MSYGAKLIVGNFCQFCDDEKINKFTVLLCNNNIDEFIKSACKM